jgi:ATP-dependent Clp protease ATP-binding subunit ClpC
VEVGYDQTMGARPLRRAVQSLIVDPVTDMIIRRQIAKGTPVEVDARDGELVFTSAARESEEAAEGA